MTRLVRVVAAIGLVLTAWLLRGARSRDESVGTPILRLAVTHPWLTAGAMAPGGIVIAALVVVSGVVPITASSGHWPITEALLDFAKVRSVSTHAWGIDAPPLADEALVLKGAGHYESACVPCHGGPGRTIPPVVGAMTPRPPDLIQQLGRWQPEELFSIVKHGIKFTGMPAWPIQQRDDEVWAMVAFLRRLPTLDTVKYQQLVYGEANPGVNSVDVARVGEVPAPRAVHDICWRCHGVNGTGRGAGAFPSLAGQRSAYVYASLRAFRDRSRFSAIMSEIAHELSDDAMREVADYYERLPPREPEGHGDEASIAMGRAVATQGISDRDIPPCIECHGPTMLPKNALYPQLTGQHFHYLTSQLTLLQAHRRGGTANVNLMHTFVSRLRPDEIRDVARYYAALSRTADNPPLP